MECYSEKADLSVAVSNSSEGEWWQAMANLGDSMGDQVLLVRLGEILMNCGNAVQKFKTMNKGRLQSKDSRKMRITCR